MANDISPTLRSVRELSPHLKSLFINLKPLIKASQKGLPATKQFLGGLRPVLSALDPFLASLNPVIKYLGFYRSEITGFLTGPPRGARRHPRAQHQQAEPPGAACTRSASSPTRAPRASRSTRSGCPPTAATATRSRTRSAGYQAAKHGIFPNFDCKPSGGEVNNKPPDPANANCFVAPNFPNEFGGGQAPNLYAEP